MRSINMSLLIILMFLFTNCEEKKNLQNLLSFLSSGKSSDSLENEKKEEKLKKEEKSKKGEKSKGNIKKDSTPILDQEKEVKYKVVSKSNGLDYLPVKKSYSSPLANFSFAITEDDELLAVGRNHKGQLGLGHTQNVYYYTEVTDPKIKGKVNDIILGSAHTFFKTKDGKVFAVGNNSHGQLGIGSKNAYKLSLTEVKIPDGEITQVIAGGHHSFFHYEKIEENGDLKMSKLYAAGSNQYGQLGLGDNNDRNVPTFVTPPKVTEKLTEGHTREIIIDIYSVKAGQDHSLFQSYKALSIKSFATVWIGVVFSFGSNQYGQLGLGDNNNRNVPTMISSDALYKNGVRGGVNASIGSTYITDNKKRLFVFGNNEYGQLGLGSAGAEDKQNRNIPTLQTHSNGKLEGILFGGYHIAYMMEEGGDMSLFSVGRNDYKQLGRSGGSTSVPGSFEVLRMLPYLRGSSPAQFSARMLSTSIIFEQQTNNKKFLLNFGANTYGQLGFGGTKIIDLSKGNDGRIKEFRQEKK